MNEVMKALLERRSIRKFKPDALTKEQLGQIVEAGLYAASGKGAQSAIAVVVTNKALRDRLSAENCRIGGWEEGFDPFYGAPAIILVLANKNEPNHVYDGSLMMGNMMLAAHALGLGMPIDGDPFYGRLGMLAEDPSVRLCLHAVELTLEHPTTGEPLHITADPEFGNF